MTTDYLRLKLKVKNAGQYKSGVGLNILVYSSYAPLKYEYKTVSSVFSTEYVSFESEYPKMTLFWGLSNSNGGNDGCPITIYLSNKNYGGYIVWNKVKLIYLLAKPLPSSNAKYYLKINTQGADVVSEASIYTDLQGASCSHDLTGDGAIKCSNISSPVSNNSEFYVSFTFSSDSEMKSAASPGPEKTVSAFASFGKATFYIDSSFSTSIT